MGHNPDRSHLIRIGDFGCVRLPLPTSSYTHWQIFNLLPFIIQGLALLRFAVARYLHIPIQNIRMRQQHYSFSTRASFKWILLCRRAVEKPAPDFEKMCLVRSKLTRVQKMHWHCAIVVICSTGYSPRQSLQDTKGSSTKSQVGLYLAVVIAAQSETNKKCKIKTLHLFPFAVKLCISVHCSFCFQSPLLSTSC